MGKVKCDNCGKQESSSVRHLQCLRCKSVNYCNTDCQKADWKKKHKKVCSTLKALEAKRFHAQYLARAREATRLKAKKRLQARLFYAGVLTCVIIVVILAMYGVAMLATHTSTFEVWDRHDHSMDHFVGKADATYDDVLGLIKNCSTTVNIPSMDDNPEQLPFLGGVPINASGSIVPLDTYFSKFPRPGRLSLPEVGKSEVFAIGNTEIEHIFQEYSEGKFTVLHSENPVNTIDDNKGNSDGKFVITVAKDDGAIKDKEKAFFIIKIKQSFIPEFNSIGPVMNVLWLRSKDKKLPIFLVCHMLYRFLRFNAAALSRKFRHDLFVLVDEFYKNKKMINEYIDLKVLMADVCFNTNDPDTANCLAEVAYILEDVDRDAEAALIYKDIAGEFRNGGLTNEANDLSFSKGLGFSALAIGRSGNYERMEEECLLALKANYLEHIYALQRQHWDLNDHWTSELWSYALDLYGDLVKIHYSQPAARAKYSKIEAAAIGIIHAAGYRPWSVLVPKLSKRFKSEAATLAGQLLLPGNPKDSGSPTSRSRQTLAMQTLERAIKESSTTKEFHNALVAMLPPGKEYIYRVSSWELRTDKRQGTSSRLTGKMSVSEIKAELDTRVVDYSDCFDKESLAQRLYEARETEKAEPSTLDKLNKQKLNQIFRGEKDFEIKDDEDIEMSYEKAMEKVVEIAEKDVANDGTVPDGMTPDQFQEFVRDPEVMKLLQSTKMRELMMTHDQGELKRKLNEDPELQEAMNKFNGYWYGKGGQ